MLIKSLAKGIFCGGSVLRALRISLVFILCLGLAGCRTSIHGIDELKEKAGKEIPVSYSDTVELKYAGMYRIDTLHDSSPAMTARNTIICPWRSK